MFVVWRVALAESVFFFLNGTATTESYPLSLHDALPRWREGGRRWRGEECERWREVGDGGGEGGEGGGRRGMAGGRRAEEHTSEVQSPVAISSAVFCLKKKRIKNLSGSQVLTQK